MASQEQMKKLSDAEPASRGTRRGSRRRIDNGESLDDLLVEAFAASARSQPARVLEMRHYDVQLIGGVVLHAGCIAEMKTGEGKTLVRHVAGAT